MNRYALAALTALAVMIPVRAQAGLIGLAGGASQATVEAALGITFASLTGPLPNLGDVGTSETVGDATLSAGNTIFIDNTWSTLIPGNEIAISGVENLTVTFTGRPSTAFGFYFVEPAASTGRLDGCNAACVDSTFRMNFFLGATPVVGTVFLSAPDDELLFLGVLFNEPIDRVVFTEITGGIDNEFFGEMYVNAVPEPSTVLMLGTGLFGLGALIRRRRA